LELVSIVIGVAGLAFGLYAYYRNRLIKELTVIYSNQLIEGQHKPGVEMLYLGKPISDFIRYQVTFFNSGSVDIRPEDFKAPLKLGFDNLQVVSHTPIFASDAAKPEYQVSEQDVDVNFEVLKRNDHITFEVLTGSHSNTLTPPLCDAELIKGSPLKLHQQSFEPDSSNGKYLALTKHLALIVGTLLAGLTLLGISFYNKYQALLAGKEVSAHEQLNLLVSVNSLLWFVVFLISMVLIIFAYESAKVLSPKFRRYKFEQLVQNKN